MKVCSKCSEEFELKFNKPGNINHCPACSTETIERLGGNMTWDHKTAPVIEIKSLSAAKVFAAQTRRFGAGVTACLTTSRESIANKESLRNHGVKEA